MSFRRAVFAAMGCGFCTQIVAEPEVMGSVSTGKSFVLYDAAVDASSGCAPYLDAPVYPLSLPSTSRQGVDVWITVVSPSNGGNNYWIKGRMNAAGAETTPFHVNCTPILDSPHDSDGHHFRGSQWLTGLYRLPDGRVFSIVHDEFYGGDFPRGFDFHIQSSEHCSLGSPPGKPVNPLGCTYTALTLAVLTPGASSFKLVGDPPNHVIARPSFDFVPNVGKATGYFTNTNILKNTDGYYYAETVEVLPDGSQNRCPIRTSDLSKPTEWRGLGKSGFTANISKGEDCENAGFALFPFYLGYNEYFGKFIMVGASAGKIVFALSSDLIHWSHPFSFGLPMYDPQSSDWSNNNYPSLMDPSTLQKTQDGNAASGAITGQKAWLLIIQHKHPQGTRALAVPVTFSK